jgi:hypothetical protein
MLPAKVKSTSEAKGVFARAAERFAAHRRGVRLGFIIDATASRGDSWETAQVVQAQMFRAAAKLAALSLRLIHYGGNEMADCGWLSDPRKVAARMAGVRCVRGLTQILPALAAFAEDEEGARADAVILIGDCFEEDAREAELLALALKGAGIKVFCFLEGNDWTAEAVFRRLADITGGKFAQLGESLPLSDLCEGVTLLTAGGRKALAKLPNARAKQLLLTGPLR